MAEAGTFEFAADTIEEFLGLSVANILGGNNVLFREIATGQFSFSADIWVYFRENYEEILQAGV